MADNLYYWENPAIIKENKEDAHVIALPYDSFEEALRRGESPYQKKAERQVAFLLADGGGRASRAVR